MNYLTAEEIEELKELLPTHLHKWLGYETVPEADTSPTPNEEINEVPLLRDVLGSHSQFPESYFKEPEKAVEKHKALPLVSLGEIAPKATLNPKPGLNAKKPEGPSTLLDLALSDE